MNLLAPWFLAGLALIAGPVIAHLIRRATRERVAFSAVRFLDESAPRLDRRSRVQHPWLLVLRCLIVATLVLGFARPYLRFAAADFSAPRERRHVIAILDESASMQRAGLTDAAHEKVHRLATGLGPDDRFVLLCAGLGVNELVGADQWTNTLPSERSALLRAILAGRKPGWGPTPLDSAIEATLSQWEELAETDDGPARRELVIVSDFTASARLAGVASVEWPDNAEVVLDAVSPAVPGNASLQWLGWTTTADGAPAARVRATRNVVADGELYWQLHDASNSRPLAARESLQLLPGASQILVIPWPQAAGDTLRLDLTGDDAAFDNRLFIVRPSVRELGVHYLGNHAADDPQHSHFYLQRALEGWQEPKAQLTTDLPAATATAPSLIVVDKPLEPAAVAALRSRLEAGSFVVALLEASSAAGGSDAQAMLATASALASESGWSIGPPENRDALLGQIDFRHPLFAPFANPLYSDFTRIRFWRPQPIELPSPSAAAVVARFDDGSAAVLEVPVGRGRLVVWGSGWSPQASQWVLSSKFVPWLQALAERTVGGTRQPTMAEIGDHARLAASGAILEPASPDPARVDAGNPSTLSSSPGIYTIFEGATRRHVALNVPASESQLEPLPLDTWEQLGVPLRQTASAASAQLRAQQQRAEAAAALEGRQQAWRWLLALAAALLVVESLFAGLLSRRAAPPAVAPASSPNLSSSA